jgi:hypothetical protein
MASKTHAVLPGSKRGRAPTLVGDVDPQERVVITIGLAGPKRPGADEYFGQPRPNSDACGVGREIRG